MTELKRTICTIFLMPVLGIPRETLIANGFINSYIKDINREDDEYSDCIYALFHPVNATVFMEFLDGEYEKGIVVEDYDYKDYVILIYKLPEEYKKDYSLIREGKYSKTSKAFQKLFSTIVHIKINGLHRDEISLQYRIFNKTNDLVDFWEEKLGMKFSGDQEVWTGFSIENETLDINKIKETLQEHVK